jgi:hypothetical protein
MDFFGLKLILILSEKELRSCFRYLILITIISLIIHKEPTLWGRLCRGYLGQGKIFSTSHCLPKSRRNSNAKFI